MPPSLRERLPEDHQPWLVLDTVEEMDLDLLLRGLPRRRPRSRRLRTLDDGRAVPLCLCDQAALRARHRAGLPPGNRSPVLTANQVPDDVTDLPLPSRHEAALAQLSGSASGSREGGVDGTGVVAIDGTSSGEREPRSELDYERTAREIDAEVKVTDEAEDELYGEARGESCPTTERVRARRRWLREAKRAVEARAAEDPARPHLSPPTASSKPRGRAHESGPRGWRGDARQRLDERGPREARPIRRSTPGAVC